MSVQPKPDEFQVIIRDESFPRKEVIELLLKLGSRQLTARELISERVRAECEGQMRDREGKLAQWLVKPDEKEYALNGPKAIDPEKQIGCALSAFEANAFVLLVDDRQVEELEEEIEIGDATVVTFLKLTPLVGG